MIIRKTTNLDVGKVEAIFEEARRQKPLCSMALNWCFNEPWIVAAGNSLITYPNHPKESYYAVQKALSPVLPSAGFEHFQYHSGNILKAELFLLNDSTQTVSDVFDAYIEINGKRELIGTWSTGEVKGNSNKRGIILQYEIPDIKQSQLIKVLLKGKTYENEYRLMVYGTSGTTQKFLNI